MLVDNKKYKYLLISNKDNKKDMETSGVVGLNKPELLPRR